MGLIALTPRQNLSIVEENQYQDQARAERWRWTMTLWFTRVVLGLAILLGWQILGTWILDRFWVSSPVLVGTRLVEMAVDGSLFIHLWATLEVAIAGLVLGMVFGTLFGVSLGLLPKVAEIVQPYVMIFYTLPRIALAPLFVMYLGIGTTSRVALAFTIMVFIALLNTFEGVRAVDPNLIDMLKTMNASRWRIVQWVVLPSIVPWLLATVRIGIGMSMIGAIVAELVSSSRGLGWYMQRAAGTFDVTGVFTGMMVIALVAALLSGAFGLFEKRMLAWRSS